MTEHLDAERATALLERIQRILRSARDVVLEVNAEGRIAWISPSVESMLGRSPGELVGLGVLEVVHPDDRESVLTQVARPSVEPGPDAGVMVRLGAADGRWVPVEALGAMVDVDGPPVSVMSLRDVSPRLRAEEALRRSEERFQALSEESTDVTLVADRASVITWVSPSFEHVFGYPAAALVGTRGSQYVHPDDQARLRASFAEVFAHVGARARSEVRVRSADGSWREVELAGLNRMEDPRVEGVILHLRDVTEEREAQREGERLTALFEATHDIVGIVDRAGEVLYANRRARQLFGEPDHDHLRGRALPEIFPTELIDRLVEVQPELDREGVWSGELDVVGVAGEPIAMVVQLLVHCDDAGAVQFYSGVMHDISERKQFESRLAHQASHDPLTLLPNRVLLLERLERALDRARRNRSRVAVLFLDLDHFKVVNDSLGHDLGDRVLVSIAERLRQALRPGDAVARFGGDEFVVLCEDLDEHDDAIAIAERMNRAISGSFLVEDHEVFVGVSIGIAFPDEHDVEPANLIRDADAAMYRAKERGRGRWVVFDHALRASAVERLSVESALRRALERRELRLHYQPLVDLASGTMRGVEALLRWEHHERGLLLPGEFMAVAEETGLIVPFGAWVLEHGCREVQRWSAADEATSDLVLSVNLSGRQLNDPGLVDAVRDALVTSGLPSHRLELEVTESVLMDDVEASGELLRRLKDELGVTIAVDDFGTGYSSLAYLRRFPVDVLKVDGSFVSGMDGEDGGDAEIVAAVVSLAHALGLVAVAEGVETAEQLERVRALDCDLVQGFGIARPMEGQKVVDLIGTNPSW